MTPTPKAQAEAMARGRANIMAENIVYGYRDASKEFLVELISTALEKLLAENEKNDKALAELMLNNLSLRTKLATSESQLTATEARLDQIETWVRQYAMPDCTCAIAEQLRLSTLTAEKKEQG